MLQQTQATRVAAAYRRFLDRFPDPASAAEATTHDLLVAWSGLGYNSRAIRLRDAARHIAANGWPRTVAALQLLPGVGPYTAAAVACFAFGEQVPAIDTNLRRVLNRWTGRPVDGRELADIARRVLPDSLAGDWNQAVMDLGATLCRPRDPDCASCPVAVWCAGPDTYVRPSRQSRFAGSVRQARGAILRILLEHPAIDRSQLLETVASQRAREAMDGLLRDGIIVVERSRVTLAG